MQDRSTSEGCRWLAAQYGHKKSAKHSRELNTLIIWSPVTSSPASAAFDRRERFPLPPSQSDHGHPFPSSLRKQVVPPLSRCRGILLPQVDLWIEIDFHVNARNRLTAPNSPIVGGPSGGGSRLRNQHPQSHWTDSFVLSFSKRNFGKHMDRLPNLLHLRVREKFSIVPSEILYNI